eukprot:6104743-Amphidinium_carterae.1
MVCNIVVETTLLDIDRGQKAVIELNSPNVKGLLHDWGCMSAPRRSDFVGSDLQPTTRRCPCTWDQQH